jgi:hypothetical protein
MSVHEQSPGTAPRQASPQATAGLGIAFAAAGLYFMLVGAGVLRPPSETNSPMAIVFCAGLAFLFAGLTCMLRARAGMPDHVSEMPDSAPRWAKLSYRMLAIGVAGALATIGTWIAIGSGPRAFDMSGPFSGLDTAGETLGRAVFGLGAVIVWIYVIALTVGTVRRLFDRHGG